MNFFLVGLGVSGFLAVAGNAAAEQIRTYSVPKEQAPTGGAPMAGSDIPLVDFKAAPIHWTAPDGWKTLAPTAIRIGNFVIEANGKKADVAVESFPGSVGGEVDNVNRWRQQVGLEAVSASEIEWKPVAVDQSNGRFYDFSGAAERTLVASVPRDGNTWFFKMKGEKGLVAGQQEAFMAFLKSVRFGTASQPGSTTSGVNSRSDNPNSGLADAANPHAGLGIPDPHAGLGAAGGGGGGDAGDLPKWEAPSNWQEKAPGPMVLKSFSVAGDQGKTATVSISQFPGSVGGVKANVDRWRGQMGLPPTSEEELGNVTESLTTAGGKATLVDINGTDRAGQASHLIAVMAPHGGNTWFYKLMGEPTLVSREKKSFVHFVETVQYP